MNKGSLLRLPKFLLTLCLLWLMPHSISHADDKQLAQMRKQAQQHEKGGNYPEAYNLYTAILSETRNAMSLTDVVRVLIAMDSIATAAPLCREALSEKKPPLLAYAYWGQIQMVQRNFAEAINAFKQYEDKGGKDDIYIKLRIQCEKTGKMSKNAVQYIVRNEKKLNSDFNDFAPSMSSDILIFSSNRPYTDKEQMTPTRTQFLTYNDDIPPGMFSSEYDKLDLSRLSDKDRVAQLKIQQDEIIAASERKQNNDGTASAVNLFISSINKYPQWVHPEPAPIAINLYKNNGPAWFASNGNTLYVSYVNNEGQKILKTAHLHKDKKEWSFPMDVKFPKNWSDANICSQCVSADGSILIISAEGVRPTEGGYDLFMCRLRPDGYWSAPENLGNVVNTRGDEMFPAFDADGRLYFSSTGHAGLGGADIFCTNGNINNWDGIENMGAPINSLKDDYGIMFYPNSSTSGLLVSNRKGGMGNDDIYSFDKIQGTMDKGAGIIAVRVMNQDSKSPIADAIVTLITDKKETFSVTTAVNGQAFFAVNPAQKFALSAYVKDNLYAPITNIAGSKVQAGVTTEQIISMKQIKFPRDKKSKGKAGAATKKSKGGGKKPPSKKK
jgi:tetratricopeptide (TPR) repeat protein